MKDKKKNKGEQNQEEEFSKRIEEIKAGRKRGRGGGKGEKGVGEGTGGRRTGRLGEVVDSLAKGIKASCHVLFTVF